MRVVRPIEWLAIGAVVFWTAAAVTLRRGVRKIRWIEDVPPAPDSECPSVSVIIAVRNEGDEVRHVFRSALALDYPSLQVVAVDDRSTDSTGSQLERLGQEDRRLLPIRVNDLPPGWMGKSHALFVGAGASESEYILITDGGVRMAPDLLRRVAALSRQLSADHIVLLPQVIRKGVWERLLYSYYYRLLYHYLRRTWEVEDPESAAFAGAGAFNFLRRSAYDRFGGHRPLATDFMEDVKIGRLVKESGGKQVLALGGPLLRKRWLVGLNGVISGLTKNIFAGVNYDWRRVVGATVILLPLHVAPAVGLFFGTTWSRFLFSFSLGLMTSIASIEAGDAGRQRAALAPASVLPPPAEASPSPIEALNGFGYPLAALIFLYVLWQAALRAEITGEVEWRGTRYRLQELRETAA